MTILESPPHPSPPSLAPNPSDDQPPPVDAVEAEPQSHRDRRVAAGIVSAVLILAGAFLVVFALGHPALPDTTSSPTTTASTTTLETATTQAQVAVSTPVVSGLTDVSDVAAAVMDSVVRVEISATFRGRTTVVGSGSGVVIDASGTIVTNAHVVDAGTGVTVVMADGATYPATVVGVDTSHDLALIDIDPSSALTPIVIGTTDGLEVGDPVIAVGNPLGLEGGPSVSTGIVSALDRTLEDSGVTLDGIIQTDAAITVGSSGGALLDSAGRLIGITTAVGVSSVGVEGVGFAIPVETITQVISALT